MFLEGIVSNDEERFDPLSDHISHGVATTLDVIVPVNCGKQYADW